MSYVALYRKYRPMDFEEVVGQEHIIEILKKQITNNKVSHAYIFSGSRGTGKTSTAKVFSRAVNCLTPNNGNPCNECEPCKSILSGETTDVVEMDAASNNSVENIRAIRQEVMYATTNLKYKIYIIDEAHMLSTSAFNALLKTLEEPPENVIFILATTEEHKLIPTIRSRCIRFEFKKFNVEDIVKRLEIVLKSENIKYDKEALEEIANLSDGGLRDALSILERCIDGEEKTLTFENVKLIVGRTDTERLTELLNQVISYNITGIIDKVDKILSEGKNARYIVSELTTILIDMIMDKAQNVEEKGINRLNYIIRELSKLDSEIRQSVNGDILLKAKLLELTTSITYERETELEEKIRLLELRLDKMETQGIINVPIMKEEVTIKETLKTKEKPVFEAMIKENEILANVKPKFKEIDKIKQKVVEKDNLQLYSALSGVKAYQNNNIITFETENNFAYTILKKEANVKLLNDIMKEEIDDNYSINLNYIDTTKKIETNRFEEHLINNGVTFTEIN
ncbi:MAG: DNA polymerase III subunit gamma/tau [Clostridia bacterium]|nr:DNA polymerase III subunit gamma/tau [Clostridia bacterium]MDD4375238.1 DNA polymerase III subunit gamma/tau [Clostridia bacterium]